MRRTPLPKLAALALVAALSTAWSPYPVHAQGVLDRMKRAAEEAAKNAADAKKAAEEAAKQKEKATAVPGGGNPQAQSPNAATPAPPAAGRGTADGTRPVTLADLEKGAPPPAPIQIGEWKAMPDVVGISLHMPIELAIARLKEQYGKARRFQPWLSNPLRLNAPQKQFISGLTIEVFKEPIYQDHINLRVTYPPNPQLVWSATRHVANDPVNRATLLAALREKYGRETVATMSGGTVTVAPDDRRIEDLFWLFDEQGRRVPKLATAGPTYLSGLMDCTRDLPTPGGDYDDNTVKTMEARPPECAQVVVRANLIGDADIISIYRLELTNLPLFTRAARTTLAWREAEMNKLRQQEIEKSKVKPKL